MDEELPARVDELLSKGDPVHLVTTDEAVRRRFRETFDLDLVRTFYANDYRLDGVLGSDAFSLHRVRPWTEAETVARLQPLRGGPQILSIDVGKLSRAGSAAALHWSPWPIRTSP